MKDILLNLYAFNLKYAQQLVEDVEDELMTKKPAQGLENHPAFTLGHLASAGALMSKYLGGPYEFDDEWEEIFRRRGPGDPRQPDEERGLYPDKETILRALTKQHELVEKLIRGLDETRFSEPARWRFDSHMSTLGDLLFFTCVTHECMHLGQLASWRRAMGLPSALAKL